MDSVYIVRRTPDGFIDHVTIARLDEIKKIIDELRQQPKYQGSHWWIETPVGDRLRWDGEGDNRLIGDEGDKALLVP